MKRQMKTKQKTSERRHMTLDIYIASCDECLKAAQGSYNIFMARDLLFNRTTTTREQPNNIT